MRSAGRLLSPTALLLAALPAGVLLLSSALVAQSRPFTVALDAAHGGPDTGAILAPQLLEKNLVLALSVHLRSALTARGIAVVTTREGDSDPSEDARAGEANHTDAAACLVLHATTSGTGVHLYTSSLGPAAASHAVAPGEPPPWATAGAAFATQSLQLASELARALSAAGVPYTLGRVRLAPLDFLRCPAVAVEVAPLRASTTHSGYTPLSNSDYQQQLVNALAAALIAWRGDVQQAPGPQPGTGVRP